MKVSSITLIASVLLAAAFAGCSSEEKPKQAAAPAVSAEPAKPLTAEESAEFTVTATVQAINHATREVTLKDAAGDAVTIVVDKRVKRLDEVKVGDEVTADYFVSLAGELRPATAEETAHPIVAVAVAARAPQEKEPAAGAVRAVKVVTTVQAVDLANMLVTLKGPMGDHITFRAKKPENVKKLRVGDTIVVTYTEAMAVSLEKAAPKK